MKALPKYLLLSLFFTAPSHAFIPPVTELLLDVFSGRRDIDVAELTFRHQVQVREGEFVEITEQFIGNRNSALIQWTVPGQGGVYSDWNGKEYTFRNGKTVPSRTGLFIDYFLASNGLDFQERLLRERFVRRDQLIQYKPGYQPTGDPKTWDTAGNYLAHDDIFWNKVGKDFAIEVLGTSEGDQKRAFYISRTSKENLKGDGLRRLEWGVGSENAAWDFLAVSSVSGFGRLPKVFSLQINGMERVRSTLAGARSLKKDALATARAASRQPSASGGPSSTLEEAVRLIVRYR